MERVDAFLQRLGWQPNMTAVQKAYEIDDWCQVLLDIPFRYVETAMLDYLRTSENLTEQGTIRRIAPAVIRREAWQMKEADEIRSRPRLNAPKQDEPYVETVAREEMKAWFRAWRECFPAFSEENLDAFKERIRSRAKELNPNVTWQIPGESLRLY